jgi:hypothetical protein
MKVYIFCVCVCVCVSIGERERIERCMNACMQPYISGGV